MGLRKNFILSAIIIIFVVSGAAMLGFHQLAQPQVKGLDTPLVEFSAERAVKHIEATAVAEHTTGSQANQNVRDYIVKQLKNMDLSVNIQRKSVGELPLLNYPRDYFINTYGSLDTELENIIAVQEGSGNSQEAIMLVAHYDSTLGAPGAADDGYGVATLLETARALKANTALKNDIIFLFTDGEEFYLLGAMAFAQQNNKLLKNIKAVINLEARGNKGPAIMFRTGENSNWLINAFRKSAAYPVAFSFSNEVFKRMPNDTDFTIFKNSGLDGLDFAAIEGAEVYHTPMDNIANVNKRSLQHYGECVLPLARHLGDLEDINKTIESKRSDSVYFTVLKSVLIAYPSSLAIPFCIMTLILLIAILVIEFKKKVVTAKGIVFGMLGVAGFSFITTVVAAGIVFLINLVFTPKRHGIIMLFEHSNLFMLFIVAISLMLVILIYSWVGGKVTASNIQMGAIVLWCTLMVTTSFLMKGASYLFIWPVLFIVISRAVTMLSNKQGKGSPYLKWISFILASVPGIVLFAPTLYLIYIAMTIGIAPAVALFLALLMGILMPAAHISLEPCWGSVYNQNSEVSVMD